MNARQALLSLSVLAATTLTSCGTLNRAGKDAFVGVLTVVPVLPIYGGATDGYTSAKAVRTGLESGSAVEVLAFPFTFAYHTFEHFVYGIVHIVDFPLCLFYGAAELHPYGPEIKPLDFYQGTWFDHGGKSGTDAQTGEPQAQ
ncbi:MAG: hypothetical protein JNL08_16645 [Planctomycetes bacterium]|nr:hypothetical protein [Planctomycetota bacterium]